MSRRKADPAPRTPTRVGMISLGCSKNLVDTEVMLGHLDASGCAFVRDPEEADILVINTCGFIEPAREESIRTILDAARLKTDGRLKRLVVAGCLVQRYRDELRGEIPEVDAFVGLDELPQIVAAAGLTDATPPAPAATPPSSASRYLYNARTPRRVATSPWTAFVKIAEGCDHTCSFCAIPSFRGTFRSRDVADIVEEASALARGGVRELNLIAQDSGHFGRDRGERDGLPLLLAALDAIEELRWIRVHYLYPNTVTPGLIDAMARLTRVVKYVDLPLQHAHPETLLRMRRGGSAAGHTALLTAFREAMPEAALRTTFIVGFPGETEEEFRALLEFVDAARFDHVGVFTYSHEESTGAWALADDVPPEVKERRRARLMEAQQTVVRERGARWVGRAVEVLVEGAHPETEHLLVGRTAGQAPDVDGQVLIVDGYADPGSFARVEITDTAGYDLVGRIVLEP